MVVLEFFIFLAFLYALAAQRTTKVFVFLIFLDQPVLHVAFYSELYVLCHESLWLALCVLLKVNFGLKTIHQNAREKVPKILLELIWPKMPSKLIPKEVEVYLSPPCLGH